MAILGKRLFQKRTDKYTLKILLEGQQTFQKKEDKHEDLRQVRDQ